MRDRPRNTDKCRRAGMLRWNALSSTRWQTNAAFAAGNLRVPRITSHRLREKPIHRGSKKDRPFTLLRWNALSSTRWQTNAAFAAGILARAANHQPSSWASYAEATMAEGEADPPRRVMRRVLVNQTQRLRRLEEQPQPAPPGCGVSTSSIH